MNFFRALLAAAVISLAPVGAIAATMMADGGTYSISSESEFFGDVSTVGGAGSWSVTFNSTQDPLDAQSFASIGNVTFNQFTGLTMSWLDTASNVLATTPLTPIVTTLDTVFTVPHLTQVLKLSWASSSAGAGFDVEVSAVPVPAAGLLLLTALGGAAALRRRKKAVAA